MSTMNYLSRPDVTLVGGAVIIIIFALVITTTIQASNEESFSQIMTVGPVWHTGTWLCTSTAEFIVHGVLIAYEEPSGLQIFVSGVGRQPDFLFNQREMITFSIGGEAGSSIQLSRSVGTLSGFLTLQTTSAATATCTEI